MYSSRNSEGRGSKRRQFPRGGGEGGGVASLGLFSGGSKIGELLKTTS